MAIIGNRNITVKEFLFGYEFGPAFPKKTKNSKETYLNFLINEKLLAADGYDRRLDANALVQNNYKAIESDLASEELFKDKIIPMVKLETSEISQAYENKITNVQLHWLYCPTPQDVITYAVKFQQGAAFDSLYSLQFSDSVLLDERSMVSDLFNLEQKSPEIYKAIDTLTMGEQSGPVKGQDGWYIFKLVNKWKDVSLSGEQVSKNMNEVEAALKKIRTDFLSGVFVDSLLSSEEPIIKANAFMLLRSYLGTYLLDEKKYNDWKLKEKGDSAVAKLNPPNNDLNNVHLIAAKSGHYTIEDFINWFQVRSQYIKTDKRSLNTFTASVEAHVWKMLRDKLLTKVSLKEGYQNKKEVREQLSWWKDKLVYAVVREEISNSIMLNMQNETMNDSTQEKYSSEMNRKLLSKINTLKRKYKISINQTLLDQIKVDDQNNSKAIDIYAAKIGGIFPRPAYPTIDFLWESWQ